ncbi:hypothetical protein C7Y69_15675 [Alteromonas sp. KS69]|nr:hypothetical protein C7Y69_15675 [Alteromonas sp. KS69]
MDSIQTIEQPEVILCNLLALRYSQTDDFSIDHLDVIVSIQTAVKLLRMAHCELYGIEALMI